MRTPVYRKMCEHENTRPSNPDILADVYDSPAWQSFMGPASVPNNRYGFQFCIDGAPAFAEGHSIKIGDLMNLSLSPTERIKALNMLLWILAPATVHELKKYFDFAVQYEMRDLFTTGN